MEETQDVVFGLEFHFLEDVFVGKILDAEQDVAAALAEFVRQAVEDLAREDLDVVERRCGKVVQGLGRHIPSPGEQNLGEDRPAGRIMGERYDCETG